MSPTTNLTKSDESIKADIVAQLRWDTSVDASKVQVRVENGVATLTGSVPTFGARGAASADAWFVQGVTRVDNQLKVEFAPGPPPPPDDVILSNAENTLDWNPDIDASNIKLAVEAGVITLTGTVPTHWEKMTAAELVGGLRGVLSVINELAVVPSEELADEAIAEDIVLVLDRSTLVDAGRVDVTVSNGIVTLTGVVPSAPAQEAAFRAASRTAGVVDVRNDLVITPEG